LLDDVFLVAALVGKQHHLGTGQRAIIGNVEEVPDLLEEAGLAFLDTEILAHDYHAIGLLAMSGPIVELGHLLALEADVFVLALWNDLPFDIGGALARLSLDRVGSGPLQGLPGADRQLLGAFDQVGVSIVAQHATDPLVPFVQVLGERKVGVAAQPNFFEDITDQIDGPINPGGCLGRGRGVARAGVLASETTSGA